MKTKTLISILLSITSCHIFGQGDPIDPAEAYFGQTPPGATPELFAPGIVSLDNTNESSITFSLDGKECYFTRHDAGWGACSIVGTAFEDGTWSEVADAPFNRTYSMVPSVSPDGSKLYYVSNRGSGAVRVYECTRTDSGTWSEPVEMMSEISSGGTEYACHASNLGNIFVCSFRPNGNAVNCDGWKIPYVDGEYQTAQNLESLNTQFGDCLWVPGPDEEYLIFQSSRHTDQAVGAFYYPDLYIAYANPNGGYYTPQRLGEEFNTDGADGFPWISQDGKFLFFASNKSGTSDIYWVSLDSVLAKYPSPYAPEYVEVQTDKEEPYFLRQNYPNPFQGSTNIQFELDKPGNVEVAIYDLSGLKVDVVLNEFKQPGTHKIAWDGEGVGFGEYFCSLQQHDMENGAILRQGSVVILKQ